MIYGSNDKGEATLTLSPAEHLAFKAGHQIVKLTACATGTFKITLRMVGVYVPGPWPLCRKTFEDRFLALPKDDTGNIVRESLPKRLWGSRRTWTMMEALDGVHLATGYRPGSMAIGFVLSRRPWTSPDTDCLWAPRLYPQTPSRRPRPRRAPAIA